MNSLSKWVRGKLQHYDDCHQMLNSLGQFTADMKHFMEDRRRDVEEKQVARREAEELKRLEEVPTIEGDQAGSSLKAHSKYFDQVQNGEGKGDTAWTSPRITAKLAVELQLAKEQEAKQKLQEKEKAEKTRKRTEMVNLDSRTHLTGLGASALMSSIPDSSSIGSHPPKAKKVSPPSISTTSVISISSSTSSLPTSGPFEPSPHKSKVEILPPKPRRKPKKMDILSDDEDMDDSVSDPDVSKTSRPPAPGVSNSKPVTVELGPAKFLEVEPSKPAASSRVSQFSFSKTKLTTFKEGDSTRKQDPPLASKVSSVQRAPQSSNVTLSESSKRKKSESPECENVPPKKLPQRSLRPWEDQGWLEQPLKDHEMKKNIPECDFDLGDDFEDDMVEASVIQEQKSVSEWPEEDLNFDFDNFEEESIVTSATPSSSKSSSFTTAASSSLQELPSNQASKSSETLGNENDVIEDEDFIAQMLKRRKRSGQKVPEANIVPEDDSIVIADDQDSIWGTPQESESSNLANPKVTVISKEVEKNRPVGTADSHRKPLFGRQEQKRVNGAGGGEGKQEGRGHHPKGGEGLGGKGKQEEGGVDKKRWSSGEEIMLPEQIKPSLSSEDDIEEPAEEEEIVVRKKVVRGSQAGQRRSKEPKMAKKQRASLSMRQGNSDDDFL